MSMHPDHQKNNMCAYHQEIVWFNVLVMGLYHLLALHGVFYLLTLQLQLKTFAWTYFLVILSNIGVTAAVHRLWAHRSYKAKLPLRIFLMICNTIANQNSIFVWARDHRVHHKFTDTDADPHNINRGFFFAHIGWLLCKKHPDVTTRGKTVDLSDLLSDEVVMFQHRNMIWAPVVSIFIPTVVPWFFWSENWYVSLCVAGLLRYIAVLHGTWAVNSVAHMWGYKPYDPNIKAVQSHFVSHLTNGEGWHNYHHTFPWDYKAAELDSYSGNLTTAFIDLMAKIGMAYDLKTASSSIVQQRKQKTAEAIAMKKETQEDLIVINSYVSAR